MTASMPLVAPETSSGGFRPPIPPRPVQVAQEDPLPNRRQSVTRKAKVGRLSVFVSVGYYPDGRPGEVFINVSREGTGLDVLFAALAQTVSVALQHGVHLSAIERVMAPFSGPSEPEVAGVIVVALAALRGEE